MRSIVPVMCLALFAASEADDVLSETLSCNVGALMNLEGEVSTCTTSELRYKDNKPFDEPSGTTCTSGTQYACLTGNWAGDFDTAYGCFGGGSDLGVNQIDNAKAKIIEGCQASPTCIANNPGGVPSRGWTSCTESNCNPCAAGAGASAPTLLVGGFALLLAVTALV
ncbi:hypothetical protein TeGR_g10279 [Tetraparma gracilis]|uniref:Uncharacterized protein n=1 Tax=Tetraparma gracilis TaxID=2962635 RepID=A0ABQ6M966_9STRA|nr:hypothetical protein TeGR_g10279 [Tetraparma gracilis]